MDSSWYLMPADQSAEERNTCRTQRRRNITAAILQTATYRVPTYRARHLRREQHFKKKVFERGNAVLLLRSSLI